ncbi:MAG TPA: hypothetical protein VF062_27790 [Candidatus Limnocylindrales bacterium]
MKKSLLVAVLAAAVTGSMLSAPAHAAPSREADPTEIAAQAYRSAFPQMSQAAARAAAAQQSSRAAIRAELAKNADTFGGVWFDPPSGTFHVAVTTDAAQSQADALGQKLGVAMKLHRVSRTLAELVQQAEGLRAGSDPLGKAAAGQVGVDVTTNQVTVALPQQARATLSAVPNGVTLVPAAERPTQLDVCTARNNCNDALRSGQVVSSTDGSCSIGFTARSGGIRWALTSGHCRTNLNVTWRTGGTAIGPLSDAIDSGAVDAGAIQVTNATFAAQTAGRIYSHNSAGRSVPVNGAAEVMSDISVGDVVCLSANFTAVTAASNPCAVIGSLSDPNKRGLVRVDGYDACQGDSGGGWYHLVGSTRTAFGLHSRSDEGCKIANGKSWFSALPMFWTGLVYET